MRHVAVEACARRTLYSYSILLESNPVATISVRVSACLLRVHICVCACVCMYIYVHISIFRYFMGPSGGEDKNKKKALSNEPPLKKDHVYSKEELARVCERESERTD